MNALKAQKQNLKRLSKEYVENFFSENSAEFASSAAKQFLALTAYVMYADHHLKKETVKRRIDDIHARMLVKEVFGQEHLMFDYIAWCKKNLNIDLDSYDFPISGKVEFR